MHLFHNFNLPKKSTHINFQLIASAFGKITHMWSHVEELERSWLTNKLDRLLFLLQLGSKMNLIELVCNQRSSFIDVIVNKRVWLTYKPNGLLFSSPIGPIGIRWNHIDLCALNSSLQCISSMKFFSFIVYVNNHCSLLIVTKKLISMNFSFFLLCNEDW